MDKLDSIIAVPMIMTTFTCYVPIAFFTCIMPEVFLRPSNIPKKNILIIYIVFIFWCICAIITVIGIFVKIIYNMWYYISLIIIKLKYYNIYRTDISKLPISVQKYCNKYNISIPDEFKDPITHTLMIDPILLPMMNKMDIFISKPSIHKCLEIERRNPFDRQYLDINILNEYNNRKKIIKKTNNFKKKLSEWKEMIMKKN